MTATTPEGWESYAPVLRHLCRVLKPQTILEWGPGASTRLLLELCPEAKITSLEHHPKWYERAKAEFGDRVDLHLLPISMKGGRSQGYITWPLRRALQSVADPFADPIPRSWDLIFVDGRSRCDCLAVASVVVRIKGAVVLHDAQRVNYRDGVECFVTAINYRSLRTVVASHSDARDLMAGFEP